MSGGLARSRIPLGRASGGSRPDTIGSAIRDARGLRSIELCYSVQRELNRLWVTVGSAESA